MAVQDIQVGAAYLLGIAGAITMTPAGGSDIAATMNIGQRTRTPQFTLDEVPSQDSTIIEAAHATKQFVDQDVEFFPKAATRALAEASVDTLIALPPLKVITVAASTVSAYNGEFNLIELPVATESRDGKVGARMKLRQYQKADGTFGALALITG